MAYFLDKTAGLTPLAYEVIVHAATERPYSGAYQTVVESGSYLCRRCGLCLFRADSQFTSSCGWPSFDVALTAAIEERLDVDGQRTEIRCQRCCAHLGHVFTGEQLTPNNKRYCVNAVSLDFVMNNTVIDSGEVIVAGGCFWGVEYYLNTMPGVLSTSVGYTGGQRASPTYDDVCHGNTGHYEAVRVLFDPSIVSFSRIVQRFFEIHDPTQANGQGPDLGHQYQSAVFCYDEQQIKAVETLIDRLVQNNYAVKTQILPVQPFWLAEAFHQQYYAKQKQGPYCHQPVDRFHLP